MRFPAFALSACLLLTALGAQRLTSGLRKPRQVIQDEICRGNLHYVCQNEECIPLANARCDGVIHCQDGSDESGCPGSGCILPQQPTGGSFQLAGCTGNSCDVVPGSRVPSGSYLTYRCNEGFKLTEISTTYCHINAWLLRPTCVKNCPAPRSESVDIVCEYNGGRVSCESAIIPGTKATLACKYSYKISSTDDPGYREIICSEDGTWNHAVFECIPECGKAVPIGKPTIVNGFTPKRREFPWHVGVYKNSSRGIFDYICGGTLISPDLVISAAHCFYDDIYRKQENASTFMVAVGKYYRFYNMPERDVAKSKVRRIDKPARYVGSIANHANDIALLHLITRFTITTFVRPICMDWGNLHEEEHLQNGRVGRLTGWGETAAGELSDVLQTIDLPYVDFQTCFNAVPEDFRAFITIDKFCAGYLNGSSPCSGDSGGGLSFKHNGSWYLRGIVSVSPTANGTCDRNYYSVFTKVGFFLDWIRSKAFGTRDEDSTTDYSTTVPSTSIMDYPSSMGCILPEKPMHGSFELDSCNGQCNRLPGSRVPSGSFLNYHCNEGYILSGNNFTACYKNAWSQTPTCLRKRCPALSSLSVKFNCKYQDETVSCKSPVLPSTKVTLTCKNFYNMPLTDDPGYREITCLENGEWDRVAFDCVAECGNATYANGTLPIGNDDMVKFIGFPWQVFVYGKSSDSPFRLQSDGTLISPDLVITFAKFLAGETVRRIFNASNYLIVAGKYYPNEYDLWKPYVQRSSVLWLRIADGYQGRRNSYLHNIALIRLRNPFEMTLLVRPICLDWDNSFEKEHFQNVVKNNRVEGQDIDQPYLPYEQCRQGIIDDDKKFVTADTFCTDCSAKGSSICSLDRYGKAFGCKSHGLWFLQGLINIHVQPLEKSCKYHSVYTKVGGYLNWIRTTYDDSVA